MSILSGDELNERMEGSTSASTGETYGSSSMSRCGPWEGWSDKSDGVRLNTSTSGDHTLMAHGKASNRTRDTDHLHFYQNKETGDREVKDKETGTVYISEQIGNAVRNFMGW
jgi:hypothetical protein